MGWITFEASDFLIMFIIYYRRVCCREVFISFAVCQGTVSWIPRGKLKSRIKWSLNVIPFRARSELHFWLRQYVWTIQPSRWVSLTADSPRVQNPSRDVFAVRDLGHGGPGALPQPRPDVLPRRPGRHRGLRYHQRWHLRESQVLGEGAAETGMESGVESVCALHLFEFQASPNIVIALSGNKADLTTNRIGEEKYQY